MYTAPDKARLLMIFSISGLFPEVARSEVRCDFLACRTMPKKPMDDYIRSYLAQEWPQKSFHMRMRSKSPQVREPKPLGIAVLLGPLPPARVFHFVDRTSSFFLFSFLSQAQNRDLWLQMEFKHLVRNLSRYLW